MKKIGLIDYFLNEWHANNLPQWVKDASKGDYEVAYAYGKIDSPDGMTSAQWCETHDVTYCESIEEVIEKSDVLMVLSPDNPEMHKELCDLPLKSGKITYVDKTFAPDYQTAKELVELAETYNTPMFSSSALRFSKELEGIDKEGIRTVATQGPGVISNYSIHQLEMIVYLMGAEAEKVMFLGTEQCPQLVIAFSGNRSAVMGQYGWGTEFSVFGARDNDTYIQIPTCHEYFERFVKALLEFFESGIPPVDAKETLLIATLRELGIKACNKPGEWISL